MSKRFIPLAKPLIGRSERRAVSKVLASGNLAQGPEVEKFENVFSKVVLNRECIAVNSGTSGLIVALLSLGIGRGDEVIVPSFTFAASANSIALVGAKPVFIDIDPRTFNLDVSLIEKLITSNTKAIMPVHLYGLPANMPEIVKIAEKYKLKIIEDAAQAHLAAIHSKPVGTFGHAAVFSFYPTKNMTSGEGGMVTFAEKEPARMARLLRNQGMIKKYHNEVPGYNFRMSDIHAAIGIIQLKKLSNWTEKRQENAEFLNASLVASVIPEIPAGFTHVFHQYTIRINKFRDEAVDYLMKEGIGCGVYYPIPVHQLPCFNSQVELPVTNRTKDVVLSLPIHPNLSKLQLKKISSKVNLFMEKHK